MMIKPFFKINDKGDFININSIGELKITKDEESCQTSWKVSMVVCPSCQTIELSDEYAKQFIKKYVDENLFEY